MKRFNADAPAVGKWEDLPVSRATAKQKYAVGICEKHGAPKFRGKTLGSLSSYLSEYYSDARIKEKESRNSVRTFLLTSGSSPSLGSAYRQFHKSKEEVEDIAMGAD